MIVDMINVVDPSVVVGQDFLNQENANTIKEVAKLESAADKKKIADLECLVESQRKLNLIQDQLIARQQAELARGRQS